MQTTVRQRRSWHPGRLLQHYVLYAPRRRLVALPTVSYVDFRLPVSTGEQIHGWYFAPPAPQAPVVIYCHGKAGNISCHLDLVDFLQGLGAGVLLWDYRGYGLSTGRPSQTALFSDSTLIWAYLTQTQNLAPEQVVFWGHSLGAAVALELALNHPQAGGLVLEGAFTALIALARRRWFRVLPLKYLVRDPYDNLGRIGQLQIPVALLHGITDRVVPLAMGEELFAQAPPPEDG
ncbi:alpha/beta hydrolase [Candidatus Cyanaurora vandensis]|uniref:alpha/beta hydrolase n=1 Tax=Candidatus Cyanaurora vandensis TaxID=2714958 RepID=UPI00257D4F0F|nr:alpha/beta fold hydrolase [Candidatus Cyanaurora vandensis]